MLVALNFRSWDPSELEGLQGSSFGCSYRPWGRQISFGFQIRLGADTQYRGERYIGFDYLPQQLVDETWTSNAHVGFGPDDSRWEILAYIRNIEDERYGVFSPVHPLAGFVMQGLNPPQTYGVRLSASF